MDLLVSLHSERVGGRSPTKKCESSPLKHLQQHQQPPSLCQISWVIWKRMRSVIHLIYNMVKFLLNTTRGSAKLVSSCQAVHHLLRIGNPESGNIPWSSLIERYRKAMKKVQPVGIYNKSIMCIYIYNVYTYTCSKITSSKVFFFPQHSFQFLLARLPSCWPKSQTSEKVRCDGT